MGLFKLFKKVELTDEQKRWNKIWELWTEGKADSPYAELMTYQSEVNNGGHAQYFYNVGIVGDIQKQLLVLETILPEKLKINLHDAYNAYLEIDRESSELNEEEESILDHCDSVIYENEEIIDNILQIYASTLSD